jgi:ribosomal protein S6--L-glutamate ligase
VGKRVVATMRRTARAGEFRSNLHRGGLGLRVKLDRRYAGAAIAATEVMGLEVAGVDMLEGSQGPKILEINSSPGLEGIERASGVDVATAIVAHAEKLVARRRGRPGYAAQLASAMEGEVTALRHKSGRPMARTSLRS